MRMSAKTWAFVRLTVEPPDGGPQPKRTSLRPAVRARSCMLCSGESTGSSEATRRRASSRRKGVMAARPSAERARMEWTVT